MGEAIERLSAKRAADSVVSLSLLSRVRGYTRRNSLTGERVHVDAYTRKLSDMSLDQLKAEGHDAAMHRDWNRVRRVQSAMRDYGSHTKVNSADNFGAGWDASDALSASVAPKMAEDAFGKGVDARMDAAADEYRDPPDEFSGAEKRAWQAGWYSMPADMNWQAMQASGLSDRDIADEVAELKINWKAIFDKWQAKNYDDDWDDY